MTKTEAIDREVTHWLSSPNYWGIRYQAVVGPDTLPPLPQKQKTNPKCQKNAREIALP